MSGVPRDEIIGVIADGVVASSRYATPRVIAANVVYALETAGLVVTEAKPEPAAEMLTKVIATLRQWRDTDARPSPENIDALLEGEAKP